MASVSLKELSKAIQATMSRPALPLPDSLVDTIAAYLERQDSYEDSAADRLQDELLAIFDKMVKGTPAASGPWIAILRRLLPALQTPARIMTWFDACKGFLDRMGLDKLAVDETVSALMDLVYFTDDLDMAAGDWATNPIVDRLFSIWVKRFYPALAEGNAIHEKNERLVRQTLKAFGKKRPREFFTSMDGCLVKKQHRRAALRFLCDFIQDQPPHLHQVLHTSIFCDLLMCLQHDTSTTVISSALTALVMLLPHMPSSLVPHLPSLFNIYTRILFWDREKVRAAASDDSDKPQGWDVCAYDAQVEDLSIDQLPNYYTILYGLYPINFMDYIRKPHRYLRHAQISGPDEVEVQPTEIRHRSERFRRCHVLHPNFYTLTIDTEKTDFARWIKSEPAEVLVECMALRWTTDPESADDECLPPRPGSAGVALGKADSRRSSQIAGTDSETSNPAASVTMRCVSQSSLPWCQQAGEEGQAAGRAMDSPTIPAQLTVSPSPARSQLQDMIQSNKAIKSGLHQSLANDSVPSLSLSHQESAVDKPGGLAPAAAAAAAATAPRPPPNSPAPAADLSPLVTLLQRRLLVLENDLSFERYVKQQHMAHIGELRRRQVVEAATEAETQNLVIMNRNLRSRFEEAKKAEMQVRIESEKGRALAKKREADMATKFRSLRDESKKAGAELDALRRELEESRQEREKLRKLVCEAEVKELSRKQNVQSTEGQGAEVDRLRAQVGELTRGERDRQAREVELKATMESAAEAEARAEMMKLKLEAQEHDARRAEKLLQAQVAELQAQLGEALEERTRAGANSNLAMESAFAASRAKQAELQKQYKLLARKYTALQSSLLDMQAEAEAEAARAQKAQAAGPDSESTSARPVMAKAPAQRSASETEATAYNATPPLASYPGSPTSAEAERRGSASQAVGGSGSLEVVGPLSMSPGTSTPGTGGLQGRPRKESRERGKEDAGGGSGKAKKEKKSSGLRGIRGFV